MSLGTQGSGTRCVVLAPQGGLAPADLLSGLSRRGVSTAVVADPAAVMVELARFATGALIVVQPDLQPDLPELIQAVKAYYPRTVRWCYRVDQASGKPQLGKLNGHVSDAGQGNLALTEAGNDGRLAAQRQSERTPLARVDHGMPNERVRSLIVKVDALPGGDQPLISEEELSMLLGPVPEPEALDDPKGGQG